MNAAETKSDLHVSVYIYILLHSELLLGIANYLDKSDKTPDTRVEPKIPVVKFIFIS